MAGTRVAKTFGIERAWISIPNDLYVMETPYYGGLIYEAGHYGESADASWVELESIQDGILTLSYEEAEMRDSKGIVQKIWYHSPQAEISLRVPVWNMRVLEVITGSPVSSYVNVDSMQIGTVEELTPPSVSLKLECTALDDAGHYGHKTVYIYRAKSQPPSLPMRTNEINIMELSFIALSSIYTYEGRILESPAYGQFGLEEN